MKRLIVRNVWLALFVAFLAAGVGVNPAAAQELAAGERILIMVPRLAPTNGADDGFGKDVAEELRDLINELHTHEAVSDDDIDDARDDYDLDEKDLYNCIRSRQLAMQKNWGLVLCGEYEEVGNDSVYVEARFVGSQDGQEFKVEPFTVHKDREEAAAQRILQTFDRFQTQLRHTVFCQQYMDSQQWDEALENCNTALEINPTYVSALYKKAFIFREMERYDDALQTLDKLLEQDPIHQDALKLAGIVATTAGQPERAREYFDRYMELNPGDVAVRLTIARDISNAGDPAQALAFAQEGLEIEPDNLTLLTYIGHFAANAANEAERAMNTPDVEASGAVDPSRVTEYYQTAAESYQKVYQAEGAETDPQILDRLIVALFKLQNYDQAVKLGARATESHPDNADIWQSYSRALQEAGRYEEALAALDRAVELKEESSAALVQRRAQLLLEMDRDREAVATLVEGAQAGLFGPQDAFNTIFAHAYNNEFQNGNLDAAFALLDAAGPVAESREHTLARNFWRGYILYQQARAIHDGQTAAAARRALPLFEQALEYFEAAQGYEQIHASADVPKFIDGTRQFIEIEQALIERGR
ncbi:MAG: tetratricopeptide repeat protein [Candidatus Longimicrobiales bacterium M2_2A_002]